jgi:hypothetical protein
MRRNWIKLVLDLNIPHENIPDALQRKLGFNVSTHGGEHFMEVQETCT